MEQGFTRRSKRGFLILDAIVALSLLGTAALVLAVAVGRTRMASVKLADSREAIRAAEAALCDLQAGRPLSRFDTEAQIVVQPATGATDSNGWQWMDVIATAHGQRCILTGLVPRNRNSS